MRRRIRSKRMIMNTMIMSRRHMVKKSQRNNRK